MATKQQELDVIENWEEIDETEVIKFSYKMYARSKDLRGSRVRLLALNRRKCSTMCCVARGYMFLFSQEIEKKLEALLPIKTLVQRNKCVRWNFHHDVEIIVAILVSSV